MVKIILTYLFISFITLSCSGLTKSTKISDKKILVHGHRGARGAMPENSISGFKYALGVGVDVLELDLAVTKDLNLILSHEPRPNDKICKFAKKYNHLPFYELTLKEVKTFDCGSKGNPRFPKQKRIIGEKIPTLEEVFNLTENNKNILFNIETKIFPYMPNITPTPQTFAKLLVTEIENHHLVNRVIVQSFDYRTLEQVKLLNPKIKTAQLVYENLVKIDPKDVDFLSPYYKWITKEEIARLKEIGIKTAPWTVNDKKGWRKMIDFGVNGIITDYPAALIKYLKSKNLR